MLKEDLTKAIEKNLSQEVGTLLKEKLQEAETNIDLLRDAKGEIQKLLDDRKNLIAQNEKLHELQLKHNELIAKEIGLQERERDLRAHDAELKCQYTEQSMQKVFELVKLVFKSPVYSKTIDKSITTPTANEYGSLDYRTTTESVEETKEIK